MHKFVGVLDNPHKGENFFRVIKVAHVRLSMSQ